MLFLSDNIRADVIEGCNSITRSQEYLRNNHYPYFGQMISQLPKIYILKSVL